MRSYWIGIRSSAVISIIGSLLSLLLAGLMLFSLVLKPVPAGPPTPPFPLAVIGGVMAGVLLCFAVWGVWTAIDIFRRRGWARISIVVFAVLLTFVAVSASLAMLVMPLPAQGPVDQKTMDLVRWGIGGFYGVLAAIGIWWLVLFNLRSSKEYFAQDVPDRPRVRPVSISVIAWWLLAGSVMCLAPAMMRLPAFIFGVVITGWTALGVYLVFVAAQAWIGAGLLRRNEQARVAAIGYFCLTALNGLVSLAAPGFASNMQVMQREMPRLFPPGVAAPMPQPAWIFVAPAIAISALPIWFLVRQRAAFVKSTATS